MKRWGEKKTPIINRQNRTKGRAGDSSIPFFFPSATDRPANVGGCDDKVKQMRCGGSRCARLFLSSLIVKLFSEHLCLQGTETEQEGGGQARSH